jgi:polyisoprenoid-binding protein YceI
MRKFFALTALFALLATLAAPVSADRKPYVFDRSHSEINFVAEALLLTAHGFFERWEADVQVDADNLENSALTLNIETASINTRNERRDNHLRSADFFDATTHPQITFVSKKVTKVDDKNIVINGDLTIRGVTKNIDVPVRVMFLREGRGRFKGEFQINRMDYGVKYNSRMNPIEDVVNVQFDLNVADKQMMEERQRQRQQQPPPAKQPPAR